MELGSVGDHVDTFLREMELGTLKTSPAEHNTESSKGFSFTEVGCMPRSTGKVVCCHFSSDGKLLASTGHEKKKERPQRWRSISETRLRDDRGNRRDERVDRAAGDDRYDRNENSPRDPSKNDDLEGCNPDDPMYDNFGGQGMRGGPSFPSDVPPPPPLLMRVPGSGPLGPFIPAPLEVAMRMLREQGDPSPFEGNGRKGRNSPQMNGPGPILAIPLAFRQDPRPLQSYNDLDAPEDEVPVIDYRSL